MQLSDIIKQKIKYISNCFEARRVKNKFKIKAQFAYNNLITCSLKARCVSNRYGMTIESKAL